NTHYGLRNTPKVIAGVTSCCTQLTKALYETIVDTVIPVSSTRTAELVKLFENTFRSVNIGLVNELAMMANLLSVDVWEVISAAGTKPYGFTTFYPGPGIEVTVSLLTLTILHGSCVLSTTDLALLRQHVRSMNRC